MWNRVKVVHQNVKVIHIWNIVKVIHIWNIVKVVHQNVFLTVNAILKIAD